MNKKLPEGAFLDLSDQIEPVEDAHPSTNDATTKTEVAPLQNTFDDTSLPKYTKQSSSKKNKLVLAQTQSQKRLHPHQIKIENIVVSDNEDTNQPLAKKLKISQKEVQVQTDTKHLRRRLLFKQIQKKLTRLICLNINWLPSKTVNEVLIIELKTEREENGMLRQQLQELQNNNFQK